MSGKSPGLVLLLVVLCVPSGKAGWISIGPYGGDARSLVADPSNPDLLYLGTRTGQVYASMNGGRVWTRLSNLNAPVNWVVDHLVINPTKPQVLYAGMWSLGQGGGGIFKSVDGGRTWATLQGIQGQSVRALALAPSQSDVLVAGTLEGVFRSEDAGAHWQRISPLGHAEIRNVESVAIDPQNPNVIYAGTWHLPWKTTDGGANWFSIKKGMVDDSDVFSIAIDPAHPSTVYATACSGIYRSDNGGGLWRKIQGIPTSSRRTHILVLDPRDPKILYAGTTEGLWRTPDGGRSWQRLTAKTWTINAIVLDPREPTHFHIAMDQAGVMESWDGGGAFRGANWGFSQRQISSIVEDPQERGRLYVSLLHDGEFGGVFTTRSRGATWEQLSTGLGGRDVLSLLVVTEPTWRVLAGTPDGVFEYSPDQSQWQKKSRWEAPGRTSSASANSPMVRDLFQRSPSEPIYAATSAGLFESADGRVWKRLPLDAAADGLYAVASFGEAGQNLLTASSVRLVISRDNGRSWVPVSLDGNHAIRIHRISPHPTQDSLVFAATELGLFRSADAGQTWAKDGRGLPASSLSDTVFSRTSPPHLLAAGAAGAFYSLDGGDWYTRIGNSSEPDGLPMGIAMVRLLDDSRVVIGSIHNGLFLHDGKNIVLPGNLRPSR